MSNTLVLNSKNIISPNNNVFQYNFLNSGYRVGDNSEISVSSVILPYSFYNVSTNYKNTTFRILIPTGTIASTLDITISEGFYTINDIQKLIEQKLIENNYYLINASGDYVFYLALTYNVSAYKIQLICTLPPIAGSGAGSLPAGWTNPGWPLPTTTSRVMQLVVFNSSVSNFYKLIGFTPGFSYPSSSNLLFNFDKLSDFTPVGSNINSIIVRYNLVSNQCAFPSDILDSFGINTSFGSNIIYSPPFDKACSIKSGVYTSLTISLQDQDFNDITILDPNTIITLLIKNK